MVVFVYALLVVVLLAPNWRMLRIVTIAVAVCVGLIALIDPIPIGLVSAILLHTAVFFGLGSLIVWLMGRKSGPKNETPSPPG